MKIKVKGLVFAGAAAAILLSAGAANAAKTARSSDASGIVTSQKYSDEKYEYWADKTAGANAQGVAVEKSSLDTIARGADGDDKYPSMKAMQVYTNTGDTDDLVTYNSNGPLKSTHLVKEAATTITSGNTGYNTSWRNKDYPGSDSNVPSEKAVITALNAVNASIGQNEVTGSDYITATPDTDDHLGTEIAIDPDMIQSTNGEASGNNPAAVNDSNNAAKLTTAGVVQRKQTATNKYQVSKDQDWTDVRNAISADEVYLAETENTTDGSTSIGIKESNLIKTAANVVSATDAASGANKLVTASATQSRSATAHQIATATGGWEAISSGVTNGTYVTKQTTDDGTVKLDIAAATTANAISGASSSSSTTLVTDYAVKQYVSTTGLGGTLNPMPVECGYTGAHCALVSSVGQNGIELTWTVMAGGEGTAPIGG